ncbi:hypothetical protein NQ318_010792 [Aromia moschata]|uniref:Uncharacterized protein n=1 Tax=Aromia moschata TaxID=1265417 RepID=A0AAV8XD71_9CUCU|nr:hypothetical protein NQ318_010792 [Aromia moschata]
MRKVDLASTDSEADSETVRNGSPDVSSAASDSPTPTNSVQDRSWVVSGAWQGLVSEEQRQLLGTEEESSDKHSSEEDTEVAHEVWTITTEQREYYTNQFRSLQPDTNALLAVVLRRNHIELPDILPPTLIPGNETPVSVSPETEPILSPQTKDTAKEWTKFIDSPTITLDKDPKILHPVPLRVTPEVANNQTDDQIDSIDLHSPKKVIDTPNSVQASQNLQSLCHTTTPTSQNSIEEGPVSLPAFPPPKKEKPPPPPPRPFKTHGRSSSLDLNRLSKLGAPPMIPPRVSPNIQSSKKLINQRSEGDCISHETDTPFANFDQFEKYENVSEDIFPGDVYEAERKKLFAQFCAPETTDEAPRKHGAFEIYRKPAKGRDSPVSVEDKAKWQLFKQLQEENTVLLRICQELSQELADLREEKLTLKVRLEKQMNGG